MQVFLQKYNDMKKDSESSTEILRKYLKILDMLDSKDIEMQDLGMSILWPLPSYTIELRNDALDRAKRVVFEVINIEMNKLVNETDKIKTELFELLWTPLR